MHKYVKDIKMWLFSAQNLHDFKIFIGSSHSQGNFLSNGYTLCGSKSGQVGSGQWEAISCSSSTLGQFVALQIPGSSETLAFCEIAVFTTSGKVYVK
jgi:hypothetical protein